MTDDVNAADTSGWTQLRWAARPGRAEVRQFLRQHGAKERGRLQFPRLFWGGTGQTAAAR